LNQNSNKHTFLSSETLAAYTAKKRKEAEEDYMSQQDERIRDNFELDEIVRLGQTCKQFWNSDIGRFIMDRAARHADHAKDRLVRLSRADLGTDIFIAKVEEYQQAAGVPALVWTWINDAIRESDQESVLHEPGGEEYDY